VLEERGNALLGNLLSLLSASEFMFAFGGEVLPPHLEIHGFVLSMIESGCWESLPTNRCLKVLRMESCNLGGNTLKLLSSAVKRNSTLQRLMLDDTSTAHGRFGAFGDAWAVNLSLKMLRFHGGRIQESDLYDLAKGLRRNRTWKVLWLPCDGLTPQEFGRLLETTVREQYPRPGVYRRLHLSTGASATRLGPADFTKRSVRRGRHWGSALSSKVRKPPPDLSFDLILHNT